MSLILAVSILLRSLATLWAVKLVFRFRDWRIGFMPLALAFMTVRQILTLTQYDLSLDVTTSAAIAELPGLLVSFLILPGVMFTSKLFLRSQAMDELKAKSDLEYRTLFESANDAIMIFDPDTEIILKVNKRACEVYGFTEEEFVGMSLKSISKDVKRGEAQIRKAIEEGSFRDFETAHFRKDGSPIHFLINSSVLEYGGRKAILSINHDITGQKRALQALEASEEKYRTLIERMNEGVLFVDNDDVIMFANNRLCEMLGFSLDELVGKVGYELLVVEEDRETLKEKNRLRTQRIADRYEMRMKKKSGEIIWLEISGAPMLDPQGRVIGSVGIHTDVTERKMAEREIINLARFPDENPNPVLRVASDGTIIYANQSSRPVMDAWGTEVGKFMPWFLHEVVIESFARNEGREVQFECSDKVWSLHLSPVRDAGYVNVYSRDVTEAKRAEEALRYRIELEKLIMNISTNFINLEVEDINNEINAALKAIGKFVDVDRTYLFMLSNDGLTVDNTHEWCGKEIEPQIQNLKRVPVGTFASWMDQLRAFEAVHVPSVASLRDGVEKELLESQSIQSLILLPLAYEKSLVGFLGCDSVRAEKSWDKDVIALLKIVGEIFVNAMKRKEDQEQLNFQVNILQNVQDIVIVTDFEGKIQYWNFGATRAFGYLPGEMTGKTPFALYPDQDERQMAIDLSNVLRGRDFAAEWKGVKKNGTPIWVDIKITLMHDAKGKPSGFLGVAKDITERKLAEEERKSLEAQVRQAQKLDSLGTLAGGIAHDFNNILGIILGHVSLISQDSNDHTIMTRSTDAINRAVERGTQLVRQILTFARRTGTKFEPVDINNIVRELLRMLERTFPKTVLFSTELDTSLPPLLGDANQVHQALLNLCVNARDAITDPSNPTGPGGVLTVRTKILDGALLRKRFADARSSRYVCISVSDDGMGMDDVTKQKMFEPFFTTKEVGKGTGLGLAVVYGTIKSVQGFVEVESETGRGTTFTLFIPATACGEVPVHSRRSSEIEPVGGQETILLVEDEDGLVSLMKMVLEGKGYRVMTASDGLQAVQTYAQHKDEIALVVTDIGLPKLDGAGVFSTVREINPEAKIIIASGYLDPLLRSELSKAGAREFVQKPYVPREVLKKIRDVIDAKTLYIRDVGT